MDLYTQDTHVYLFFTWPSHARFLSLHVTNDTVRVFTY